MYQLRMTFIGVAKSLLICVLALSLACFAEAAPTPACDSEKTVDAAGSPFVHAPASTKVDCKWTIKVTDGHFIYVETEGAGIVLQASEKCDDGATIEVTDNPKLCKTEKNYAWIIRKQTGTITFKNNNVKTAAVNLKAYAIKAFGGDITLPSKTETTGTKEIDWPPFPGTNHPTKVEVNWKITGLGGLKIEFPKMEDFPAADDCTAASLMIKSNDKTDYPDKKICKQPATAAKRQEIVIGGSEVTVHLIVTKKVVFKMKISYGTGTIAKTITWKDCPVTCGKGYMYGTAECKDKDAKKVAACYDKGKQVDSIMKKKECEKTCEAKGDEHKNALSIKLEFGKYVEPKMFKEHLTTPLKTALSKVINDFCGNTDNAKKCCGVGKKVKSGKTFVEAANGITETSDSPKYEMTLVTFIFYAERNAADTVCEAASKRRKRSTTAKAQIEQDTLYDMLKPDAAKVAVQTAVDGALKVQDATNKADVKEWIKKMPTKGNSATILKINNVLVSLIIFISLARYLVWS